jgi:hypothetical protein
VAPACASQCDRKFTSPSVNLKERTNARIDTTEIDEYPTASAHVSVESTISEAPPTPVSVTTCQSSFQQAQSPEYARAPCKLVTLLAENPAADITQVSLDTHLNSRPKQPKNQDADGIECSAAYSMLMRHATSGEKMDRIAAALESGCTPSAGGGCRVKKGVVWKTLDQECT